MRYPKSLQKGGTIGFVAPSFGCNVDPYRSGFENAQKKFREMGYGIQLGPNCYAGEGIGISNTPEKCAAELMEYYCSPENDVLLSCGGGELMCEVLSHMDFERIKAAEPKWYMGYSDNTNFTYLQATLCDTASIYGPSAASFGMEPWHQALQDAFGLLTGVSKQVQGYEKWEKESLKDEEHPLEPYNLTEERHIRTYIGVRRQIWGDAATEGTESESQIGQTAGKSGECTDGDQTRKVTEVSLEGAEHRTGEIQFAGRLLGGCMDCLVNLLGTRFDKTTEFIEKYKTDGIIWFLESCDLNVFAIRRAMWQMEEAGWFRYVKGFLIGRPLCFGQEMMGLDAYHAILEVAGRKNVPVIMDVDLGHLPPMMPIVVGSIGEVTVEGNDISIRYQFS